MFGATSVCTEGKGLRGKLQKASGPKGIAPCYSFFHFFPISCDVSKDRKKELAASGNCDAVGDFFDTKFIQLHGRIPGDAGAIVALAGPGWSQS